MKTIEEIVDRVETLPRLRDTAMRLIGVIGDPSSTIEQIVDTIRYDQIITAQVLRLCNSAYFGLARQVSSLDDSIRFLGTTKVLQLVMAAHTQNILGRAQEGYGLAPGGLWWHSVSVALAGQNFAHRFGIGQGGLVFTAGLLHDVGKIVLNEFVRAEFLEIIRCVNEDHLSFLEAEHRVLGFTHAEIGARVAENWNLPSELVEAINRHHEPDGAGRANALVDAIHLADTVAMMIGVGSGYDGLAYRACPAVLARRELNKTDLESVGAETIVELKSVQKLFASE